MAIRENSNGNWQAGKNVLGCNEYMLNNQIYCDVTFKVGTAGKEVKAHKYVLASRSSVFAAMLYGSLSEANDVIAVPDIEAEIFNILLKFLYFEDHGIDDTTVITTLYAAEKYAVTELVGICQSFLESKIAADNVCVIMENARMFNMADLLTKCKDFIFVTGYVASRVFESDSFLDLKREILLSLVESDELPLEENFIYQSLIRWAKHKCVKEGKENPNLTDIRKMLANTIFEVRFPTMSLETFWKDMASDEILTPDEKVHISQVIVGKTNQNTVFKSTVRKRDVHILRSQSDPTVCSWGYAGSVDAIEFEVNKPVSLCGILLYGNSNNQYSYDVEIKIISLSDIVLVHMLPKKITESCKMFQVNFDKPCKVNPNERYTVWVKMNGSKSYRGNYSECVEYKDHKFKFYKSKYSNNGTDVGIGQIPGLLCYLK
ncbi:BTB/POZ domain-containing protein 6-like [Crassostrea angulata]|uniref:BTB/POZ domain-containing protein 6-like n=1 Tax=Magallana angulata TaxID=2784310 RepID=UPI0022B1F8B5|nr:BTB/POZ domain-containing protein 6-like [Crassostrea angulata]XP_052694049.1 BTB/POZ domain-containing protein 6-like [Crassostrea angulata]